MKTTQKQVIEFFKNTQGECAFAVFSFDKKNGRRVYGYGGYNFEVAISNGATHVIFNDGNKQTVDILIEAEGYYLSGMSGTKYNVKKFGE